MIRNTYKGTREQTRALGAFVKLIRAAESVSAGVHSHLSEAGLSISQFGVLEALYHLGPLSQADLARKILKSTGNVTMVIDNLEKRGLVARERDPEDRRYYAVHLTGEGTRTIASLFPRHATGIVTRMNVLTASEQETLGTLCRKLGTGVKKNGKGASHE